MKIPSAGPFSEGEIGELLDLLGIDETAPQDHVDATLSSLLHALLYALHRRAIDEDREAADSLADVAANATRLFEEVLLRHPDYFETRFRGADFVPVKASREAFQKKKVETILEYLQPGQLKGINTEGKQGYSQISSIALRIQQEVYRRGWALDALRAKSGINVPDPERLRKLEETGALLPRFTKDTIRDWWPHCKGALMEIYGQEFQSNRAFQRYWENVKFDGMDEREKRRALRKRILDDLRQALKALAVEE